MSYLYVVKLESHGDQLFRIFLSFFVSLRDLRTREFNRESGGEIEEENQNEI